MRKWFRLIILLQTFSMMVKPVFAASDGGMLRTGIITQVWAIENIDDPIKEITIPIEVVYPIRPNLTIQINHSPASSQFGGIRMAGLSDTYIRSNYALQENRAMLSLGIGLPTGKTELDDKERSIASLLSYNAFKFHTPVFGQGLTISAGGMYAYPINDKLTVGAGVNYVYRGRYKYTKYLKDAYDPGDQIGANIGFDYLMLPILRSSFDVVMSYYTADKLSNTKMYVSGPKLALKLGLQYQASFGNLWLRAYYSSKSKNQTWNDQSLVLEPQDKNYNITLRELEIGAKIPVFDRLTILISGEGRSYVENELNQGWVDVFGPSLGYLLQVNERLGISMETKFFYGDGDFYGMNPLPHFSGFEFYLTSQYKL
ncbi:MAG: hypothetical protein ONB33_11805 [candidate division KSB1 bacterium]|nr:hypothetical protein [candidate division KSB1 bacterium]MDZ7358277.1 hypothetical protein [candidate division KSB1 bacterium]MDZ7401404.1 hypothetical protein [candidate division KSB1 bacterium]